jgi:hypothetical protein
VKTLNEWKNAELKTITITCRDLDNTLEKLLNHIKQVGNTGHTFNIIVDPRSDDEKRFEWDGDGSDYIKEIKIS